MITNGRWRGAIGGTVALAVLVLLIRTAMSQHSWHGEPRYLANSSDYQIYRWTHARPDGSYLNLKFRLQFPHGIRTIKESYKRMSHYYDYGLGSNFICFDPYRTYLHSTVDKLRQLARIHRVNAVDLALSFVQSMRDLDLGTYQSYAVETLVYQSGDCSDKSFLFAGLLWAVGFDCVMLRFVDQEHLAVGLGLSADSDEPGYFYWLDGRKYYFCETSAPGWFVGQCPPMHRGAQAEIERICRWR